MSSNLRTLGRAVALALAAVAAAVMLAACGGSDDDKGGSTAASGSPSADKGPIVVASWGGKFTRSTREFLAEPFTEETGIEVKIVDVPGTQVAQLKAQQKAGKVQWDLLDSVVGQDAFLLEKDGLIEPLPAELQRQFESTLTRGAVEPFGFTFANLGYVVACNADKVDNCPANTTEFFDAERFPGDRTMCATCPLVNLTMAELAAGTPIEETASKPIDLPAALGSLEKLKPSVKVFWQSGDQMEQVMRTGEASIGILYSGRALALKEEGLNLEVAWDGGVYEPGYWAVVRGSKHAEAAREFMRWIADNPEAQAKWAEAMQYSVPNPRAFDLMPPDVAAGLADNPQNAEKLARMNFRWMVDNADEVNGEWKSFLQG